MPYMSALQPGVPHGGGRGGVCRAARDPHLLLPEALQDGGLLQEPALLPRGRASNEGYIKVREDLTITAEKAPTIKTQC